MIRLITRRTYANVPGFMANLWKKKILLSIPYYQVDIQYSDQFQSTETLLFLSKKKANKKIDTISAMYKQIHDAKMSDEEAAATQAKDDELERVEQASLESDKKQVDKPVSEMERGRSSIQPAVRPIQKKKE